jgi:hypothetical protein
MFEPSNGVNGFIGEGHSPVRLLKYWLYQTSSAIDKEGAAGDACEMSRGIKTVKNIRLRLKDHKSKRGLAICRAVFNHEWSSG